MALTFSGQAAWIFNVTESDPALTTGTFTQLHNNPTLQNMSVSAGLVASAYFTIDTIGMDVDLNSFINYLSGNNSMTVERNQSLDFTTLKMLVIVCTHATIGVRFGSPSANSLFTWQGATNYITVPPSASPSNASGISMMIPAGFAVGAANGKFNLKADSGSGVTGQIFIYGT